MDITAFNQPIDRVRLASILDTEFGAVTKPEMSTEQLLQLLEAKLGERSASRESLLTELGAWRAGALTLADCTCKKPCPVHGLTKQQKTAGVVERLPGEFVVKAELLCETLRQPRGSTICQ